MNSFNTMITTRTNAAGFLSGKRQRIELPLSYKIRSKIRSLLGRFTSQDDFEWDLYNIYYRAEMASNKPFFSEDLRTIDFRVIEGKIFILGDCRPLNLTWRCVYESIYNLPVVASLAEIGVGGGRYVANLRTLLDERVRFSAYDLSEKQLLFFKEQYPEIYSEITVGILDLAENCITETEKPDVVLASTVLMHIQRPEAYQQALHNLLHSGRKYIVLMDNWNAHDYFSDLNRLVEQGSLYVYDSGANIAIIINLTNERLGSPYLPLNKSAVLGKYMPGYKY
jgi:hypothetical protein